MVTRLESDDDADSKGTDSIEAGSNAVETSGDPVTVLVVELDAANPVGLVGEWLTEAGAVLDIRRLHADDQLPVVAGASETTGSSDASGSSEAAGASASPVSGADALVVLGGPWRVYDDDLVPYLATVRTLLAGAVAAAVPTLALGLGGQLLAVAAGGRVAPTDRARLGANLTAKRDATETDALFASVPITPDVMQFRREAISALPSGGRLLLNSVHDPVEAFRVGSAAWGAQFHIETDAGLLRAWRDDERWQIPAEEIAAAERRFGEALDEAAFLMGQSWRAVTHRFVELAREGIPLNPFDRSRPLLPMAATD